MNFKSSSFIFVMFCTSTLFAQSLKPDSHSIQLARAGAKAHGMVGTTQQSQVADARSVHLWYDNVEATVFYNEATVTQSVPGSYFMVCGFSHGYFGMQELANSEKVIIFSVWDPGDQNDPSIVAADKQVKILWKADDVRTARFGGEGTGAQSFYNYDWQINQTYKYLIKSTVNGNRTAYDAYFFLNETGQWKHLASFETLSGTSENISGMYSFVEDFLRNYQSPNWERSVFFSNSLAVNTAQQVVKLDRVTFTTIKDHPLNSINAWVNGDKFGLATGGSIQNTTAVNSVLQRNSTNALPTAFKAMYKSAGSKPSITAFPNKFSYNGGSFTFNPNSKTWQEKNANGTFNFTELSRSQSQALLYDQSRNVWLRLDSAKSICDYSQDKINWVNLYQLQAE